MELWHYHIYSQFKAIEVRDAAWATAFRGAGAGAGAGAEGLLYIKFSVISIWHVNSGISLCALSVQDCTLIGSPNLLLTWAPKYRISALTISVRACQLFIVHDSL